MHFYDFDIIRQPSLSTSEEGSLNDKKSDEATLMVLLLAGDDRQAFLFNVLKAAGYTAPEKEVVFVELASTHTALDLATLLLRQSKKLKKVMIFGLSPKQLGLHFNVGLYVPVEVNNYTFLLADDLSVIRDEKSTGNTKKAGALWNSVKAAFMKNT